MFKKLFIVGVAVLAGLFILNKTNLGSYAGTAFKKIKAGAKDQVPIEFEIERVKDEVSKLVPDMRKHISTIAEEMVAVENLREDVNSTRVALAKQKDKILAVKADLEGAKGKTISYRGNEYPVSRVRDRLVSDWESYQRAEEGLKSKEKLLDAKEEALVVAREQLGAMKDRKEQLEVEVARLEADLKNVRLAQTRSNFQLDDSRLSKINASLQSIRDRLNVDKKKVELNGQFSNALDIPVEKTKGFKEVYKEIDDHFGTKKADGIAKDE